MNGIDATLVKMMRKIEMQAQSTVERYQLMNAAYGNNKNYVKRRDYLNRYYEGVRKTRRAEEGKRREERIAAEKRARQLKKMQEKEKIVQLPAKPMMVRSPQPILKRKVKVIELDQEEVDRLRYLGITLDAKEGTAEEGTMLRKSMSMNNII